MSSEETQSSDSSTASISPPAPAGPQRIGPYRILEVLGEGGMGTVYKAEQRAPVKRTVALKLIKPGFDTAEVIARFQSERQALARMDHPNVAKVLDAGADDMGRPYFVMEYVPGVPITKFADEKKLSVVERLELFVQVCEAIAHAHTKAIIHRDIKSSNVLAYLADNKAVAKVIDFGVAKALTGDRLTDRTFNTSHGQAIGTYESMSPEQADGSPDIDTRTDVYSLGVLLYELLTGIKPFDKETFANVADAEIRRIIREVDPPRPSTRLSSIGEAAAKIAAVRRAQLDALTKQLRSELEWIPLMAMRKERDRRYANPLELAEDIGNYLENRPLRAGPESLAYRARKYMSRNAAPLATITTIAVLLVAGATTSIILALRARTAEKTVASQLDEVKFQRNQAITANQRADSEAGKLKRELSEHYVDEGVAAWQKENPAVAMLWFVKALQLDSGDPQREHLQRIRIGTSLARSPRLLNVPAPPINHANIHGGRRLYAPYATVQILDIYGKPVIDPIATGQPVRFVSFSPSGKLIVAVTTDNTARVYDASTGKPICSPLWHRDEIHHAAFSPNDKLLVTSSTDESARIWDVASGKPVSEPLNIDAAAYFGIFSPNSKMMIICADDNTAQLWEGSYFHTYLHHDQRVEHAEFSPDNTLVATASRDKFARVWEVSTYSAFPALLHQAAVSKVHFSPDNQRLLTAAQDNTARIWDVASGEPITPPLEHPLPVSHLAFSADGRYAFTVDSRDTVRVWDATPSTTFSDAHLDWADDPTISPDGKRLVTTSGTTARLWNIAAARPIGEAMEHEDSIQHAAFSPDGNLLVTASADNYARVWNAHTGKPIRQFRHKSTVLTAAFSPDSRCVISADNEGTIDIWNARSGESVLPKPIQHRIATHAVFSPDGRRVATASNMTARLWDARTGASVGASMEHSGLIYHVAFNPSSTKLITTSEDNSARIWDAASGNPLTPPMPHDSDVYTAIFSHDGKYAVTGTVPGETIVWDASTGKPLTPSLDDREFAHRTAPGPDESVILGGADGSPPLWTVRSTSIAPQKLEQIAQLLSAQRLDETGTLVRLSPNEWRDLWNSLRQEFPAYFAPPPPGGQSPSFAAFKQWAEKNIKADDINVEEESSSRIVFENLFPRFWLNSVHSSIGQLTRQIEGHATINKVDPGLAKLHAERANNFGRLGRFREASADLAKAIALDPGTDHFDYFRQAILLAYLGDTEGYIKHCRSMVARFKGQPAREVADRTAKACLLLPDVVPADPAIINQLVDRALGLGPGANLLHWFEMTKGIAEYRGGRPEHAAGWLARATTGLGNVGEPLSLMFMAMCEKKLGHEGAARKLLAEATVHLDKKQPKPGREDLTEFYHDWVVNQLIRREAEMLILGKTTVPRP